MAQRNFLHLALAALLVSAGAGMPARAETAPPVARPAVPGASAEAQVLRLAETLQIGGVIEVMRQEGVEYGATLRDEMFAGKGGQGWDAAVARIYDQGRMRTEFDAALVKALAGAPGAVDAAQAFFGDARGQKILELELEARRALLDDATETAAQEAARQMQADSTPRFEALSRFATTNDLIEMNVMGALNANLAFYRGLSQGGAFDTAMTEDDMLAEVWAQEADVRQETEDWLWPYLSLAYGPLSDEELQAYTDFSATPEGRQLNAAVFTAFDALFVRISAELGRAAARQMLGEDI